MTTTPASMFIHENEALQILICDWLCPLRKFVMMEREFWESVERFLGTLCCWPFSNVWNVGNILDICAMMTNSYIRELTGEGSTFNKLMSVKHTEHFFFPLSAFSPTSTNSRRARCVTMCLTLPLLGNLQGVDDERVCPWWNSCNHGRRNCSRHWVSRWFLPPSNSQKQTIILCLSVQCMAK